MFFDQGLKAAAITMPCAVVISLIITSLFMGGSDAKQFNQSLAQTYRQLGQLYQAVLKRYLQGKNTDVEMAQHRQVIAVTLAKHPMGFKIAGLYSIRV